MGNYRWEIDRYWGRILILALFLCDFLKEGDELLRKLDKGLTKNEYVIRYMKDFKRLVLTGDRVRNLTVREEELLRCEERMAALFYEQFVRNHKRAPDVSILEGEVKSNFLARSKVFARVTKVTTEYEFVQLHINQIRLLKQMRSELFSPDNYNRVLEHEKRVAQQYFRKHDDYPTGYEILRISQSYDVVEQGLNYLLKAFYEIYRWEYRKYQKMA